MQQTAPRQVNGVFFDLYGTLLILGDMKRAWSDWIDVLYVALSPKERAVTREDFDEGCHQFFGKEEPKAEIEDGLTVFERRLDRLTANLGFKVESAMLKETASRAVNAWQMHVQLDPDAAAVLSGLAESKTLALISNFDHPPHAHRILRDNGLAGYFKTVFVSGDVGIKKPNPAIFRIALEQTGLNSDEVVYVGDTQEDVDGATAAGIKPILIARPQDPEPPKILDYTRNHQVAERAAVNHSVLKIRSLRELIDLV